MEITSLRRRIERLINTHSSAFAQAILDSGFACMRCGWCCRENFKIRITSNILRPSNAVSIFPGDIRRIAKSTGMRWNEIAEPDIYSCFSDGENFLAIGWILHRNDAGDCVFYRKGECAIYALRPIICRCYPFFMSEERIEIMHCNGLGNEILKQSAEEMARMLRRYEIKKLQSYIRIITQMGKTLKIANLRSLPRNYSGYVLVFDGEVISRWHL